MAKIALLMVVLVFSRISFAEINLFVYDYPPLVVMKNNQPVAGLSYELVDQLFIAAEIPLSYSYQPLRRALYSTERNKNTCAFPVERNQSREASYRWIGPVAINRFALFSSPENKIDLLTLEQAKQYPISGFAGTGIVEYLKVNGFDVFETKKIEHGLQMLIHNRVKLWVSDTHTAAALAKEYKIERLEPSLTFFTAINFMACNLDMPDETYNSLSETLSAMYQNGAAQNILKTHLINQ